MSQLCGVTVHVSAVWCHCTCLSCVVSLYMCVSLTQGEIRAFAFNEVADKMQGQLEMGQVRFPFHTLAMTM